ncbi:hypothetical protein [Bradyrhizobium sp. sGM-13]|uniref:hypothetical protein n=1 Tax=Bradyrhizobium sp. sGM-13 TaxID=2831781 RepID=UPI0020BDA334|nr:hypothetical protein [Bradyrhizobium sp. sGM-13]
MLIDLSRVRVSGPLSAFAIGFADHMTRQGYSQQQARIQLLLLNRLSNWLVSKGLDVGELRAKEVEQFQLSRHEAGDKTLRSIRAMQPILGYLRGLGIAPRLRRLRSAECLKRPWRDTEVTCYLNVASGMCQRPGILN